MTKLDGWKMGFGALLLCAAVTIADAQVFTSVVSLNGVSGSNPMTPVVQGRSGYFYGTAVYGDFHSLGGLFGVSAAGNIKNFYRFCQKPNCADGIRPYAPLLLANDGNFYGTTYQGGGTENGGTVFRISPTGTLTTIYDFCASGETGCPDGILPWAGLIQGNDGNLYGTTSEGAGEGSGLGTVFKITVAGKLTTLVKFNGNNGEQPLAGLTQATDGNFYGTTYSGSPTGSYGTVFKMTPNGNLTTLYNFCSQPNCADGIQPQAGLIQASDGSFYGTTDLGGNGNGCNQPNVICGTIFKITSEGNFTILYSFCAQTNCTDGAGPEGGLIQGTDGNFYGTTVSGGLYGSGTIFSITPEGNLTTLYSFCALGAPCVDGALPESPLLQSTTGVFYGTTFGGGSDLSCSECGTVFSLDTGLGPFVAFVHPAGSVGQAGGILGQGFIGTTSVMLNGIPATFTIVSDTFIRTTVPAGATTGYVTVSTPTGVLTSNVPFHVIP